MKKQYIFSLMCFLYSLGNINAQQTPAPKQTTAFSIEGATAHLGNGEVIENSLIMFADGKITFVGSAMMRIARTGNIINAKGKHIYPGFIVANASLGLVEIDAVRATDDEDEVGTMLPHIRSLIAYNTESKIVESMRPNGVLIGQIVPRGGTISGTSSVVQFDAWNWEDAAIKKDNGLHINWPNSFKRGRWWLGEERGLKSNEKYADEVLKLTQFFNNSRAYIAGDQKQENLPFKSMETVFNNGKKVFVHVDGEREIVDAIQFKKDQNLKDMVIVGGYDALKVADLIKAENIAVLSPRPHSTPNQDDEDYDYNYKLAKLLTDKGILVGLESSGQMERASTRNLPFYAGTVAASGMGKEEALKLITLNNAKILGIDDRLGTLEKGKDATLFISEGDALDMRTNILTKAFIQGRELSLESHQTELYHRYSDKYENQVKTKRK